MKLPSLRRKKSDTAITAAPKRKRPGFIETVRSGWKPAHKRPTPAGAVPSSAPVPGTEKGGRRFKRSATSTKTAKGTKGGDPELLRRREELSKQFAELNWDLGGLTYEMATRDNFRVELLTERAAELKKIDSELGQVERLLKMGESGAAGACPSCGALQARGAMFCWQCGKEIAPASKPSSQPPSS